MEALQSLTVNGIPFLVIIFGLVEFTKKLGLKGTWLTVISMILGIAFGVGYELSKMYPEVMKWYGVGFFGLTVGLAASGVYDFLKSKTPDKG
jgi:hypothetical protein